MVTVESDIRFRLLSKLNGSTIRVMITYGSAKPCGVAEGPLFCHEDKANLFDDANVPHERARITLVSQNLSNLSNHRKSNSRTHVTNVLRKLLVYGILCTFNALGFSYKLHYGYKGRSNHVTVINLNDLFHSICCINFTLLLKIHQYKRDKVNTTFICR